MIPHEEAGESPMEVFRELDRLRREVEGWKEDAHRQFGNRDYWKAQYDAKQVELAGLRELMRKIRPYLTQWNKEGLSSTPIPPDPDTEFGKLVIAIDVAIAEEVPK